MGLGVPIFRFPGIFTTGISRSHFDMTMFPSLAKSRSSCPFGGRESKTIGKRLFGKLYRALWHCVIGARSSKGDTTASTIMPAWNSNILINRPVSGHERQLVIARQHARSTPGLKMSYISSVGCVWPFHKGIWIAVPLQSALAKEKSGYREK